MAGAKSGVTSAGNTGDPWDCTQQGSTLTLAGNGEEHWKLTPRLASMRH